MKIRMIAAIIIVATASPAQAHGLFVPLMLFGGGFPFGGMHMFGGAQFMRTMPNVGAREFPFHRTTTPYYGNYFHSASPQSQ